MRCWVLGWFFVAPVAVLAGCVSMDLHPDRDAPSILRVILSHIASAVTYISEGSFRMAQRAIRFSDTTDKGIQEATRKRGFSSPTAFIRYSVEQELSDRGEELVGAEERLAATIEQVRRDIFRLGRARSEEHTS